MNTYYVAGFPVSDTLAHHGIKGQKWGIRRYQNYDGTLTSEGKLRYQKMVSEGHDMPSYFSQKLGDKAISKIDKLWYDSLDELAYGDLVGGVKDKGRAALKSKIDDALKESEKYYYSHFNIRKKILEEEQKKAGLDKTPLFYSSASLMKKYHLANEKANARLQNDSEYMKFKNKHSEMITKITKLENQYKDMSMSQIINKFPKSQQEDVLDYLRLIHWDDQIYD